MPWQVSTKFSFCCLGHEICRILTLVHTVFQNDLTDPNEILNMVVTIKCGNIFCDLNNRVFLKVNKLDQNMWGSWLGRRGKRKVLHFQMQVYVFMFPFSNTCTTLSA
jgi:hypothetical protein